MAREISPGLADCEDPCASFPIQDIPCFCNSVMISSCALFYSTDTVSILGMLIIHNTTAISVGKGVKGDFWKAEIKK